MPDTCLDADKLFVDLGHVCLTDNDSGALQREVCNGWALKACLFDGGQLVELAILKVREQPVPFVRALAQISPTNTFWEPYNGHTILRTRINSSSRCGNHCVNDSRSTLAESHTPLAGRISVQRQSHFLVNKRNVQLVFPLNNLNLLVSLFRFSASVSKEVK